jgi:thioredoxin-like negative regulator of GroEL
VIFSKNDNMPKQHIAAFCGIFFVILSVFLSCKGQPEIIETPLVHVQPPVPAPPPDPAPRVIGIAEEIRSLVEIASPSSLLQALDTIRSRDLSASEYGRAMNAVVVTFMKNLYPDIKTSLPMADPPQTHIYTKIMQQTQTGNYTVPNESSTDYLEYVLPFFALLNESDPELLLKAIPDLEKAETLNPDSVLAPYFLGLTYEKSNDLENASLEYTKAYDLAKDMYPAVLGLASIQSRLGNLQEAINIISELVIQYPDNVTVKRRLAIAYYNNKDWSRAESAVAEILQQNPRDGQFLLMRSRILIEEGLHQQAQAPLDVYAAIDASNSTYLFLRARVQAEGYRNADAALNYLRSILRNNPQDEEAAIYAARLMLRSSRLESQEEGRAILQRYISQENPSAQVRELAVEDAIRRESWQEAQSFLEPLLLERRSSQDLLNAYTIQRSLGNNASALAFAREVYERESANEDAVFSYVSALIDTGRTSEAGSIIESKLSSLPGGVLRSRYYFLRSRLRSGEEAITSDLRSSLFEDPRNLEALIAMFEMYHRQQDSRRAVYYLKQALAIVPNNPQLMRYQTEYAAALNASF